MKDSIGVVLAGIALLIGLFIILFYFWLIGVALYGLYLSFSASIILGIVVLFVEPVPLIIGLFMVFLHKNLAQEFMYFLTK